MNCPFAGAGAIAGDAVDPDNYGREIFDFRLRLQKAKARISLKVEIVINYYLFSNLFYGDSLWVREPPGLV